MSKTTVGLILTLGGAPCSPHRVGNLPGMYRPDRPTPTGGPGECTASQAIAANEDPGCPVALVQIPNHDVQRLRLLLDNDVRAERGLPQRKE